MPSVPRIGFGGWGTYSREPKPPRCAALQSAATQWRVPATLASTHNTHIERRHRLWEYTHMGYGRIFNISENTLSFTSRIVLLNVILLPLQYFPQNCFGGDKSTLCNSDILFKLKVIFCWCRFYGGYYIPNEYLWTPVTKGTVIVWKAEQKRFHYRRNAKIFSTSRPPLQCLLIVWAYVSIRW